MAKCTQGAISAARFVFSVQPSNVQTTMTTLGVTCMNSEHHGQARGWGNVKATLRWGVFLFLQLFKMLSEHQHLTHSMSRPHEGLHTELVLSAGTPGCGASVIVLRDEMR